MKVINIGASILKRFAFEESGLVSEEEVWKQSSFEIEIDKEFLLADSEKSTSWFDPRK